MSPSPSSSRPAPAAPRLPPAALRLLLVFALVPGAVAAQNSAVVDEGTFMVSRNGSPIGRESFRIVRAPAPGGQAYEARSRSALGRIRISTILGTDSLGVPVSYESELSTGAAVTERLKGRGRPGRFSVLVQTRSGEAAREYVLGNGALLIDEDVIHQYYFLRLAGRHADFNIIGPRSHQQARFHYENRGSEMVEIAGQKIVSQRFALIAASGSARELWLDGNGRLLKISIPERNLVAVRDDPPRQ